MALTPERAWWYAKRAQAAVEALRRHRFEAVYFASRQEALEHILALVPKDAVVGFGDSLTLRELDLHTVLMKHGCKLVNPPSVQDHLAPEDKRRLRVGCFTSDVYFCSTNAISLEGQIVNIDGIGNRVAPMLFGPPKVVIVAGANKLADSLDAAMARVKCEAAPLHAWRDGYDVPCGHTGACNDCRSPSRMCRATVILEGPTKQTETHVVLVGEDLGL